MKETLPARPVFFHTLTEWSSGAQLQYEAFPGEGEASIAFIAGIHGNEKKVIEIFREILEDRVNSGAMRKTCIFVPRAHPEALDAGTREGNGLDLNRQFPVPLENPTYPRARLLAGVLREYPIRWLFTIHEDTEMWNEYYAYVSLPPTINPAKEAFIDRTRRWLARKVRAAGYDMFNGIDDPALNNYVREGYVKASGYDGSIEDWAGAKGMGTVTIEIPGQASREAKKKLLRIVFDSFILPVIEGDTLGNCRENFAIPLVKMG